jgi:hypothetical protein
MTSPMYVTIARCLTGFVMVSTFSLGIAVAQIPGAQPASFPESTEPGPYILPIPSFLEKSPNSLYLMPNPGKGSGITRPTTVAEERPSQVDAALSVSSGYDSAVNDLPDAAGGILFTEGYLGIKQHKRNFDMLLQHNSQLSKSFDTGLGLSQYQRTTASFVPTGYERTMWSLLLENGYGSDVARAAGNISPSSLSGATVPDVDATAFNFVNGNTLTDHVVLGTQHRINPLRTLEVQAGGYYHHFFEMGTSDQQFSLSTEVDQRFSRNQTFGLQAEAVEEHYSTLNCTTGSLNIRSVTQISESTKLEGRVGPIWGTATCAGTFQYNVSLTSTTAHGNSFYIGSARAPTNGFVQNAAWEEFQFGGFSMGNPRQINIRTDAGYSRYVVANPSPANPDQRGFFASTEAYHRVSDLAEISMSARFFYRDGGMSNGTSTALNRGLFLLTFRWSKEQRPSHISTFGGDNANH